MVEVGGGELKRPTQFFFFQVRVLWRQLSAIGASGRQLRYAPDRDPQPADAGLAARLSTRSPARAAHLGNQAFRKGGRRRP
jgi:hypothetical protein